MADKMLCLFSNTTSCSSCKYQPVIALYVFNTKEAFWCLKINRQILLFRFSRLGGIKLGLCKCLSVCDKLGANTVTHLNWGLPLKFIHPQIYSPPAGQHSLSLYILLFCLNNHPNQRELFFLALAQHSINVHTSVSPSILYFSWLAHTL